MNDEYKANFLWGHEDGTVEALGYEFANAKTEEYRKECWNELITLLKDGTLIQLRGKIEAMKEELEKKTKWKYLLYPDGESRGRFPASPWTKNIYPWLKGQTEEVFKLINDEMVTDSDSRPTVGSMEKFQKRYFPSKVGEECPYCGNPDKRAADSEPKHGKGIDHQKGVPANEPLGDGSASSHAGQPSQPKMHGTMLLVTDRKKLEELSNKIQASLKTDCTKFVIQFSEADIEITKQPSGAGLNG